MDPSVTQENPGESPLIIPKGAYETFFALAALAIFAMVGFVFAYGFWGDRITDGLDRACAEAHFEEAKRLAGLGNSAQALQAFRRAMDGHFRDEEQRYMCGRSIGDLLMKEDRFAEAIVAYEALPVDSYNFAGAYTGYVTALWRNGQFAEATTLGERWLEMAKAEGEEEQQLWAHNVLMRIGDESGNAEMTQAHAQGMLALDPNCAARLFLARVWRGQRQYDKALAEIDHFLRESQEPRLKENARKLREEVQAQQNAASSS